MWSEAIEMLARAERLHRQSFQLQRAENRQPCWEPPVDVFETESEIVVLTALPGVDLKTVQVNLDDETLEIFGRSAPPPELRAAEIHRLELPQGAFRRRVGIPPGRYDAVKRSSWNGCLVISLLKYRRTR
jgi:HSP20 family molecular chaperone IbpA